MLLLLLMLMLLLLLLLLAGGARNERSGDTRGYNELHRLPAPLLLKNATLSARTRPMNVENGPTGTMQEGRITLAVVWAGILVAGCGSDVQPSKFAADGRKNGRAAVRPDIPLATGKKCVDAPCQSDRELEPAAEEKSGRHYARHVCFGDVSLWCVRAEGSRTRLIASRLHQGTDVRKQQGVHSSEHHDVALAEISLREEGSTVEMELGALFDGFQPDGASQGAGCVDCGRMTRSLLFCLFPYRVDIHLFRKLCQERGLQNVCMTGGVYKDVHYETGLVVSVGKVPDFAMCPWLAQFPGALKGSDLLPICLGWQGGPARKSTGRCGMAHFDMAVVVASDVHRVRVKVASTHQQVDEWLQAHVLDRGINCLGVDLEWRPSFRRGSPSRVALVQIAAGNECLLVPLLHLDTPEMPERLGAVLRDGRIRKVGVGLNQDARLLQRDWSSDIIARVDLAKAVKQQGIDSLTSLAKCTRYLLGLGMSKSKKIRMGNWEQHPLSRMQSAYAALDAWVAVKGLQRLENHSRRAVEADQSASRPLMTCSHSG